MCMWVPVNISHIGCVGVVETAEDKLYDVM